jgi:hypothetical protein
MNSLAPIGRLLRNGIEWIGVRWSLFDILVMRRDPMHADLPGLVIRERELRP